jgi:GNAT superfamily N-acetyltransferase
MLDTLTHIIRPAMSHELPDLAVTIAAAFETFRGTLPDRILYRYIAFSADIGQHAGRGDIMVLESEGKIAGTVVYYANAGTEGLGMPSAWAGFRTLAVHPKERGHGFGRSLVEYCIGRARSEGARTVGLHTADFMKDAVAIYRRMGFKRTPEYDLKASAVLGLDPAEADILVTAYKLKL